MSAAHKISTSADIRARRIRLGCDWLKQTRHLVGLEHSIPARQAANARAVFPDPSKLSSPLSYSGSVVATLPAVRNLWRFSPIVMVPVDRRTARDIIKEVATTHDVTLDEIVGEGRTKRVVRARHEAMWAVHVHKPYLTSVSIGRLFNRDHTLVLYVLGKLRCGKKSTLINADAGT